MISHKYKSIFIHIPKTAGSSIQEALLSSKNDFRNFNQQDFDMQNIPPHAFGYNSINKWDIKHMPARFLKNTYKEYYKFCFVRNPWDLMVSCYFWWIQNTKLEFRKLQGEILKKMGFNNFIMSFYTDYINEIFHSGMGQSYWILDYYNRNDCVGYIGRYENLQNDFDAICDIIGINKIILKPRNKTVHSHYRDYYTDDDAINIIKHKFEFDIKRFKYSF